MSTLQVPRADVLDVDADAPPAGFGLPTGDVGAVLLQLQTRSDTFKIRTGCPWFGWVANRS